MRRISLLTGLLVSLAWAGSAFAQTPIETYIYGQTAATGPYGSGLRIPAAPSASANSLEYIPGTAFLQSANNLSDLANAGTARTNLGLGSLAVLSVLPNPGPSALGGIESLAPTSHEWINAISTAGVPSATQPGFADLSGSASAAQISPNLGAAVSALCSASTTNFVRGDGTCVAPSGGAVSLTSASPALVASPSPITGTGSLSLTNVLNSQSGASYTFLSTDATKNVVMTNTSATTTALPVATASGFGSGFATGLQTLTAGDTLSATTSKINGIAGATGIQLGAYQGVMIQSDGTNYQVSLGVPQPPTQTGTTFLRDDMTWAAPSGSGTVTSVALALPSGIFAVSGSPVTASGTLTGTLATQTANTIFAGPASGSVAAPTFRALVQADQAPPTPVALTPGSSVTVPTPVGQGSIYTLTPANNPTAIGAPSGMTAGQFVVFIINSTADAVTFAANWDMVSGAPVLSATQPNIISCTATSATVADCLGPTQTITTATGISAAGTTQGTATVLTTLWSEVGTVASGTGVLQTTPVAGQAQYVSNHGANALLVYPVSGGTFDELAANTAISLAVNTTLHLICFSATHCNTGVMTP